MKKSLSLAMEAAKTSIAVTCDLYIAKIFMQIQCQGSPKDDQLFINFRPFLIKLSFFKTLGKIVGESGGTYVLQEAEI